MSYPSTDYVYINVNGTNFTIQTNFGNIIKIKGNNTISNNSLFLIIKSNNNLNSYIYTTTGFTLKKAYSISVRDVVFGQYSYAYAISSSNSTIYKINLNSPYDVSSISFSNEDIQIFIQKINKIIGSKSSRDSAHQNKTTIYFKITVLGFLSFKSRKLFIFVSKLKLN